MGALTVVLVCLLLGNFYAFAQGHGSFPPCVCSQQSLFCSSRNLKAVPEGIAEAAVELGITFISLANNAISSLPEDVFDGLSSLRELELQDNAIRSLPEDVFDGLSSFEYLYLSYNDISSLPEDVFDGLSLLRELYLQNNAIRSLPEDVFDGLSSLTWLYLSYNAISSLPEDVFDGLSSLERLEIQSNAISSLPEDVFNGLSSLERLDLSYNAIRSLPEDVFDGLSSLEHLHLSNNAISSLPEGVFDGLTSLELLYLKGNNIITIYGNPFEGLTSLERLVGDNAGICCLADKDPGVKDCAPRVGISSCADMIGDPILRVCIWFVGASCLLGNALVVWRRAGEGTTQSYLIGNLAISDLLMGMYLLIIAGVDAHYRGEYAGHNEQWRRSGLCIFAGFLSTFSGELSVATLTVITVDRFIVIALNSPTKKLRKHHVKGILLTIWVVIFTICLVPCFDNAYFHHFYGQSEVCLPVPIASERQAGFTKGTFNPFHDMYSDVPILVNRPNGWEYSIFVFVGINATSFITIFILYVWMFISVKKTQAAARSTQLNTDVALARKMILIVGTDALCWMPVIGLGIYSLQGNIVNPVLYSWVAVIVLPINSAINPILYTMSTQQFRTWVNTSVMNHVQRMRSMVNRVCCREQNVTVALEMSEPRAV